MPRDKEFESAADKQRAYRERKRAELNVDPDLPEVDVSGEEPQQAVESMRPLSVTLALDPFKPLSAGEEQLLRDHWGYSKSETRTRAERKRAEMRMLEGKPRIRVEIADSRDLARLEPRDGFGKLLSGERS